MAAQQQAQQGLPAAGEPRPGLSQASSSSSILQSLLTPVQSAAASAAGAVAGAAAGAAAMATGGVGGSSGAGGAPGAGAGGGIGGGLLSALPQGASAAASAAGSMVDMLAGKVGGLLGRAGPSPHASTGALSAMGGGGMQALGVPGGSMGQVPGPGGGYGQGTAALPSPGPQQQWGPQQGGAAMGLLGAGGPAAGSMGLAAAGGQVAGGSNNGNMAGASGSPGAIMRKLQTLKASMPWQQPQQGAPSPTPGADYPQAGMQPGYAPVVAVPASGAAAAAASPQRYLWGNKVVYGGPPRGPQAPAPQAQYRGYDQSGLQGPFMAAATGGPGELRTDSTQSLDGGAGERLACAHVCCCAAPALCVMQRKGACPSSGSRGSHNS